MYSFTLFICKLNTVFEENWIFKLNALSYICLDWSKCGRGGGRDEGGGQAGHGGPRTDHHSEGGHQVDGLRIVFVLWKEFSRHKP